jgi:hypothetical protein
MAKIIPGFPNYSVTECGRVFGPRGELSRCADRRGYLRVWPYVNGRRKELSVHRAVALAWIDGDHSLTVNHVDSNKANNHASNLEWVSNADNLRHSFRSGTHRGHSGKRGRTYAIPAADRARMFDEIRGGASIRRVADAHGVGRATLQYQYKRNGSLI